MSSESPKQRFDQLADINPARKVRKGDVVSFVEMAALPQFSRDISLVGVVGRASRGAGAHFRNGDTLFARITPCLENGKTAQVRFLKGDAIAEGSTEFIVLCGKDPADNDFVYYVCREPSFRDYAIGRMEGTSGRQRVSWQAIAKYEFIVAPAAERRVAAAVLSMIDDRITLLRENNQTLESIAQAIFKSWFVDFDPVRAKMEGRQPVGMDEETAALFPDELVESELGLIPKGWEVGTLRRIAELNPEVWSAKNHPPELLYVDLANAKENELASIVSYGFDEAPSRARRVLRCGDTIIGTVRPGNRSYALIYNPPENLTGSTGFAILRPKENMFTEFIFLAATQDSSIDYFAHLADGAAYPAVRPDVVINLSCVVPPNSLMALFHNLTSPCLAKLGGNQKLMETLTELRDALLPRLISGKLRVPVEETHAVTNEE